MTPQERDELHDEYQDDAIHLDLDDVDVGDLDQRDTGNDPLNGRDVHDVDDGDLPPDLELGEYYALHKCNPQPDSCFLCYHLKVFGCDGDPEKPCFHAPNCTTCCPCRVGCPSCLDDTPDARPFPYDFGR